MLKVDKDGSGAIDQMEFTGLMAEILSKRNQEEEIRKVFRCYDNDDDGRISKKNIMECADVLEMSEYMNDENVAQMIELGDPNNRGYVDIDNFMTLMHNIGLVKKNEESDMDREFKNAKKDRDKKRKYNSMRKPHNRIAS